MTRADRADGVRARPATVPESGAVSAATASLSSGEGAPSESVSESSNSTSRLLCFFEAVPALRRSPPLFAGEGENISAAGALPGVALPAIKSCRLGPTPPIERSDPARPAPAADAAPLSARFAPANEGGGAARSANKSLAVAFESSSSRPKPAPSRPNLSFCAEAKAALAPESIDAGVALGARLEISSTSSCVSRATWRSSQSGEPPEGAAPEGVAANIAAGLRGKERGTW